MQTPSREILALVFLLTCLQLLPSGETHTPASLKKWDLPQSKSHVLAVHLNPTSGEKKPVDVYVALHGLGDTAENYGRYMVRLFGKREVILLVPEGRNKAGKGYTWAVKDLEVVFESLELAKKHFPVEVRNTYLTGFSAGCIVGFFWITMAPERFTAFGGFGGFLMQQVTAAHLAKLKNKINVFYSVGRKDPNFKAYPDTLKRLTDSGAVTVGNTPDSGHEITPAAFTKMLQKFEEWAKKAKP